MKNLRETLRAFVNAKEVKTRLNNNQIKINNEVVKDLDIELNIQEHYWELSDFIFINSEHLRLFPILGNVRDFFGEEPTNIKELEFLTGYTLISISKKEEYVFINN